MVKIVTIRMYMHVLIRMYMHVLVTDAQLVWRVHHVNTYMMCLYHTYIHTYI
jgi:hypothetical protein